MGSFIIGLKELISSLLFKVFKEKSHFTAFVFHDVFLYPGIQYLVTNKKCTQDSTSFIIYFTRLFLWNTLSWMSSTRFIPCNFPHTYVHYAGIIVCTPFFKWYSRTYFRILFWMATEYTQLETYYLQELQFTLQNTRV